MSTQHRIIFAASAGVLALAYFIGWHTSLGRVARGVSTVAVVNRSPTTLQYVSFYLTDSQGRQIDRHYEHLEPHRTVQVGIRTSDLIVRRIICEQEQQTFTYEPDGNVTPCEVFLVVVDAQGKMSSTHER